MNDFGPTSPVAHARDIAATIAAQADAIDAIAAALGRGRRGASNWPANPRTEPLARKGGWNFPLAGLEQIMYNLIPAARCAALPGVE